MTLSLPESLLEGPTVCWHGLRIAFRANTHSVLGQLASILPPGGHVVPGATADFVYSVMLGRQHSTAYLGSRVILRSRDRHTVVARIAAHVERTVAENVRESIFVHAGAVGWRGQAILFPGRSFSGKSTLVRALLHAGCMYLSDEFAVVTAQGLVHPFPRPLSLRCRHGTLALAADEIGAEVGSSPLPVRAVVFTRYVPNERWRPVPIPRGRAMLELLQNTVAVRSNPVRSVKYLGCVMRSSIALHSVRGEAEDVAPFLLETLTS